MAEPDPERRIEHPNRKKASSQLTRLVVIVLLLASAALVAIVTLGGWSALEGAKLLQIVMIIVYVVLAYFVARWSRGVLPLIAGLATLALIFAAVSTPAWFDRSQNGFTDPALPSDLLGLVTALMVPVQILLIAVSMSGFRQAWNVEVETGSDDDDEERDRPRRAQRNGDGERDRQRDEDDDRVHAGVRDDRPRDEEDDTLEPGGGPHRAPERPADEAPTRELPDRPRPETGSGGASPAPA